MFGDDEIESCNRSTMTSPAIVVAIGCWAMQLLLAGALSRRRFLGEDRAAARGDQGEIVAGQDPDGFATDREGGVLVAGSVERGILLVL
ncbi:MAG TPA: hypothetical protein VF469_10860, partial [Kofleriaceae bacterium]